MIFKYKDWNEQQQALSVHGQFATGVKTQDMINFPFFQLGIGNIQCFFLTNSATTGNHQLPILISFFASILPAYSKF